MLFDTVMIIDRLSIYVEYVYECKIINNLSAAINKNSIYFNLKIVFHFKIIKKSKIIRRNSFFCVEKYMTNRALVWLN